MDEQVFQLLMNRFDTLESQNQAQIALMTSHIETDEKAHKLIERHSAYFKVMSLGAAPFLGWVAYKLGFK